MCCSARPTCIKLAITIAADLLYLSHSAYRLAVTIAADPLRDRGVQLPVRGDSLARGDSAIIDVQASPTQKICREVCSGARFILPYTYRRVP